MTTRYPHHNQDADLADAKARRARDEAAKDAAIRRALKADGGTNTEIARRLGVSPERVKKVRGGGA